MAATGQRPGPYQETMQRRWFAILRRLGTVAIIGCLAVSCGEISDPPTAAAPSVPGATETGATPPTPTLSPEEVDAAVQFRRRYGLRADDAWTLAVARADAARAGIEEFGVPLMPFEVQALHARRTDQDVLRQIAEYGNLHPEHYAGAYVDQRRSMGFVVMFTADLERHGTTLANLLPEGVHLDLESVRWSTRELDAFRAQIESDLGWASSLGVRFLTTGRRVTEDAVYVKYLGPEAVALAIADHYGNPPWLVVERDGPLPWTGARADLAIDVVDANSNPVAGLDCGFRALDPDADEGGEVVFGTNERGRCVLLSLPAVAYEITLSRRGADGREEVLRRFEVRLTVPGKVIRVQIDD